MNPEGTTNTNPVPAGTTPTPTPAAEPTPVATPAATSPIPTAPVSDPIPVPTPDLTTAPAAAEPVAEANAPAYVFGPEDAAAATDPLAATPEATTESAAEPVEDPALQEPLQPAAPVPGSIGSSVSVPAEGASLDDATLSAANPAGTAAAFGQAPIVTESSTNMEPSPAAAETFTSSPATSATDTFAAAPSTQAAVPISDAAPVTPSPMPGAPADAAPAQKKSGSKTIIIILFSLVILAAIAIALYLLGVFDSLLGKTTTTPVVTPVASEHTYSIVTCTHETTNAQALIAYGDAESVSEQYVLNYTDGELDQIEYSLNANYESDAFAKAAINNLRDSYVKAFQDAGYSTEPFTTEYNNSAESSIVRTATADQITAENASLIGIENVTELDTTEETLTKNYKSAGFTCVAE